MSLRLATRVGHRSPLRTTTCGYSHPLLWARTPTPTRHHSTSVASPPSFAPPSFGSTSASTEIPYGNPAEASAAYLPRSSSSPSPSPISPSAAETAETPLELTAEQRDLLERIIRVDQAGEVGANTIYQGQHFVFDKLRVDRPTAKLVQEMWDGEKKHIAVFDRLITQHQVRPTLLYPLWKVAGLAVGATTALMGKRSAMACTEAVETVIGEHYDSQVKALLSTFPPSSSSESPHPHPSIPLLGQILSEFRDDELGHLDTAVQNESQQSPGHALLSAVIAGGCRLAIKVSGKI